MSKTGHLGVLLRNALGGVDENQAYICPLNGHGGPEDAVLLNVLRHLGPPPDTGGVNEDKAALVVFKTGVDGVPGGAGHVGDDDPLLAKNPVYQGGLAGVGFADDRHVNGVIFLLLVLHRGEVGHTGVQQIAGAVAVDGGDGDGVSQTQVVELVEIRVRRAGGVHLVHRQHDGLAAAQQHICHLMVRGGESCADVRQENDDRGGLNGGLGLLPHELQDQVVGAGLNAAGIDEGELPPIPVGLSVDAVPGDAGGVLHDGDPPSHQFVEQLGFAHIGPPHNGDDGFHRPSLPF